MNLKLFKRRLKRLYTNWCNKKQDLWGGADVLVISTPPSNSSNPISTKFFVWLLGYEFPDTIAILTNKEIHFVCSNQLRASQLKTLEKSVQEAIRGIQLVVHVKGKSSDNGDDMIMDEILNAYRLQCRLKYLSYRVKIIKGVKEDDLENDKGIPMVLGHVVGESPSSNLLCGSPNHDLFQTVDINTGLFKLVFSKEEQEEGLSKVEEDGNKKVLAEEEPIELIVWGFRRSVQDDQGGLTID